MLVACTTNGDSGAIGLLASTNGVLAACAAGSHGMFRVVFPQITCVWFGYGFPLSQLYSGITWPGSCLALSGYIIGVHDRVLGGIHGALLWCGACTYIMFWVTVPFFNNIHSPTAVGSLDVSWT